MKLCLTTILLCLAFVAAGCDDDESTTGDGSAQSDSAAPAQSAAEASERSKPKVSVPDGAPPGELVTEDLIEGSGATAKAGDEVTVHYVGVGYDSGEEFDASWYRNEPFTFKLGNGEVIRGWDQGVKGLKVGGQRRLVLPPSLAYGSAGAPPAIGPNETLIFVIDLLKIS